MEKKLKKPGRKRGASLMGKGYFHELDGIRRQDSGQEKGTAGCR